MKKLTGIIIWGTLAAVAVTAAPVPSPAKGTNQLVFRPSVGAPKARADGGTRAGTNLPLYVIAPVEVGFTLTNQPTLFYHLPIAPPAPVMFTLNARTPRRQPLPLIRTNLSYIAGKPLQEIRLASLGRKLEPGVEYTWTVYIDVDPKSPAAKNTFATGGIQLTNLPAEASSSLAASQETIFALANKGIFYDAFAAIEETITQNPTAPEPRAWRKSLLQQVGLTNVAAAAD